MPEEALTIGEILSRIAQRDFAKRFERGELSSRRPDVPGDGATEASRTPPWLPSDGDVGAGALYVVRESS
jgi:hypothetical protein